MITDGINEKWKAFENQFRTWQEQRNQYRFERITHQREQFIETLQKRYGYTKEQAAAEMHKHYFYLRHE